MTRLLLIALVVCLAAIPRMTWGRSLPVSASRITSNGDSTGPGTDVRAGARPDRGQGFPGFTAEVVVTLDGRTRFGRVIVEPDGVVHVEHLDEATAAWVGAELTTLMRRQQAIDAPEAPPAWSAPRGVRETVTVRGAVATPGGRVVPVSFAVERRGRWDDVPLTTEEHARNWTRVSGYDLPAWVWRQRVDRGVPSSEVLLLTNHRLLGSERE